MNVKIHRSLVVLIQIQQTSKRTHRGYTAICKDFTYEKLARRIGISQSCLRKHIKVLEKLSLVYMHKKNLCVKGLRHFDEPLIPIKTNSSRAKILLQIRNTLIVQNIRSQEKQIKFKITSLKKAQTSFGKMTKKQLKFLRQNPNLSLGQIIPVTLSNKKFGSIIGASQSTGKRLQKQLNQEGLIKSTKRYEVLVKGATYFDYKNFLRVTSIKGVRYMPSIGIIRQLSNEVAVALSSGS